jgi:hypothetical protein
LTEETKLFLMSVSVTQVPWETMASWEILDHLSAPGVKVAQSPISYVSAIIALTMNIAYHCRERCS